MKQLRNILILIFLFASNLSLIGQIDLNFEYEYNKGFKSPIHTSIQLICPNKTILKLYSDTTRTFEYQKEKLLKDGNYQLQVNFSNKALGKDSINYSFYLDGKETDVEISVRFYSGYNREKASGHISVTKYKESLPTVNISYAKHIRSSDYYREPFFILKNNSQDTIYGEYFPGYFWGRISPMNSDSIYDKYKYGTLDYNFAHQPPLAPDSTAIAMVGSFGYMKVIPKGKYRYEVLYSVQKWQATGLYVYRERKNLTWWADTKEYHRLRCDFEK